MSNQGNKNRLVEFWKLSGVEDAANEPVADPWVFHKKKWADPKGETGMGTVRAAASAGGVNTPLNRYSFRINFDRSITVDMQLRMRDGARFNILTVNHDLMGYEWTDVVAELGGATG